LQRILESVAKSGTAKAKYKEPTVPDTLDFRHCLKLGHGQQMPQLGELSRGKSKHRLAIDPRLYGGPSSFKLATFEVGRTIRE